MVITYEPESSALYAHLQVQVTAPEDAPLPITETGYRSHFVPRSHIEAAGGPAAYVVHWLEADGALALVAALLRPLAAARAVLGPLIGASSIANAAA